eukprot:c17659_g1_i1.p1 GENE.c17659_g1_i1~~c17659_g1_i1.p1  ORF type:complete len:736 (+),score=147.58 c17659_g1_i1:57-2264(+)
MLSAKPHTALEDLSSRSLLNALPSLPALDRRNPHSSKLLEKLKVSRFALTRPEQLKGFSFVIIALGLALCEELVVDSLVRVFIDGIELEFTLVICIVTSALTVALMSSFYTVLSGLREPKSVTRQKFKHKVFGGSNPYSKFSPVYTPGHSKNIHEMWAALIDQLPPGSFMVSYSWGAQASKGLARQLAGLFGNSICWLDYTDLAPGEPIQTTCCKAIEHSAFQFVFLSKAYINSRNCQAEFSQIAKHPERVIVFVDDSGEPASEEARAMSNAEAMLSSQGFTHVIRVSELMAKHKPAKKKGIFSCLVPARKDQFLFDEYTRNHGLFARYSKPDKWKLRFHTTVDSEYTWLNKELVLSILIDEGMLAQVLTKHSPAVNVGWLHTVSRITDQPLDKKRILLGFLVWVVVVFAILAVYYALYVVLILRTVSLLNGTSTAFLNPMCLFLLYPVLGTGSRSTDLFQHLPDVWLLLIVLRKLGLCRRVELFSNGELFAREFRLLQQLDVVRLLDEPSSASTKESFFYVVNVVNADNPITHLPTDDIQGVYWTPNLYSSLPKQKRTQFSDELVIENLSFNATLLETIGVAVLRFALHGAAITTGAYPFHQFMEKSIIDDVKRKAEARKSKGKHVIDLYDLLLRTTAGHTSAITPNGVSNSPNIPTATTGTPKAGTDDPSRLYEEFDLKELRRNIREHYNFPVWRLFFSKLVWRFVAAFFAFYAFGSVLLFTTVFFINEKQRP